jgi:DNA-binding transcriptional LysR family regulator
MDYLYLMKAFVEVARFESFTKAADHLDTSTSALSRAIRHLEDHTRTRLLNRSTRHVSLAEEGREYFALCSDVLERLREGEQRLLNDRNEAKGLVRVIAHPFALEVGLPQIISQYRSSTPGVNFVVRTATGSLKLEHEKCDIAVYPPRLIQGGDAVCRPLLRSPVVLVASSSYFKRYCKHAEPAGLSGHVIMSCDHEIGAETELRFDRNGSVTTLANAPLRLVVCETAAVNLALSGFGMALLPECLVSQHLKEGQLQLAFPGYRLTRKHAELDAAFMRRGVVPGRARGFIDACIHHFGSQRHMRAQPALGLAA